MRSLQSIFESYRDKKGFSGVVLIKKENEIMYQFHTGYENRMYQIENKLTTAFDTASITKLFTAAGIVLLEHQGKLNFEDKIHTYLDLSKTKIPNDVTIRHLLTHTSGIADDCEEELGENYSDLFKDSPNYALRENKDFLKNFIYREPNFKAGEQIYYNNCAFILLGLVIEKISNQNYRNFITEEIFTPFHLTHTFFQSKEDSTRPCAEGYFYDNSGHLKKNIYSLPPIGTADSGAYTTAGDLDLFLRTIYKSEVYRKMMCPQTNLRKSRNDAFFTTGFGFELIEKDGEILRIHKDGQNDGVCNITVLYPKDSITLTILGNVDCNIWDLKNECESILFGKVF